MTVTTIKKVQAVIPVIHHVGQIVYFAVAVGASEKVAAAFITASATDRIIEAPFPAFA